MGLDILLADNNEHTQKTLYHFLYHYAPAIHNTSKPLTKELEEKGPDVIFLDSDQINQSQDLEKFQNKPPIILLSRNENVLKEHLKKYPAQLKKPINPEKLRNLIVQLIPKLKNLKINSYLEFYDKNLTQKNESTDLQKQANYLFNDLNKEILSMDNTVTPNQPVLEKKIEPENDVNENDPSPLNTEENISLNQKTASPSINSIKLDVKKSIEIEPEKEFMQKEFVKKPENDANKNNPSPPKENISLNQKTASPSINSIKLDVKKSIEIEPEKEFIQKASVKNPENDVNENDPSPLNTEENVSLNQKTASPSINSIKLDIRKLNTHTSNTHASIDSTKLDMKKPIEESIEIEPEKEFIQKESVKNPETKFKINFVEKHSPLTESISVQKKSSSQEFEKPIYSQNINSDLLESSHFFSEKTHLIGYSISQLIDQKFKANWEIYTKDHLTKKTIENLVFKHVDDVLEKKIKFLQEKMIKTSKEVIKEICLKIIPELIQEIAKKEISSDKEDHHESK